MDIEEIVRRVAADPGQLTEEIVLPSGVVAVLRPLSPNDQKALTRFYTSLGPRTRRFYDIDNALDTIAAEQCAAIGRYDKVRLVLEPDGKEIAGIFEFSLALVLADSKRYDGYGMPLIPGKDIRYGLCLTDRVQGQGIASTVQPYLNRMAGALGARRVILWGGVYESNEAAIRFYTRSGFAETGRFVNPDGVRCIDMILELAEGII